MTSGIKRTHAEFVDIVWELVGDEYEVLSEYKKAAEKLTMKHKKCNLTYEVTPNKFMNGRRCQHCNPSKKKTTEEFETLVQEKYKGEYKALSKYKNSNTKVQMLHTTCGHTYEVLPSNFKKGTKCPKCFGNIKGNTTHFKKYVLSVVGNEYEVVEKYENSDSRIKMFHKTCGRHFLITPSNFKSGNRCSHCYKSVVKTTSSFKEEVYSIANNEYEVVSEYINARTKIEISHKECGKTYKVVPYSFLAGNRCPYCKSSQGEQAIRKWLDENNITYIKEYKFKDCIGKSDYPLRFDFAIFEQQKIKVLIEFDGKQHFKPNNWFGGEEKLRETQKNDQTKNNYCRKKGIPLVRIPYWELENINEILNTKILVKLNNQCELAL